MKGTTVLHPTAAPGQLDWRPLRRADLGDFDALLSAIEAVDDPPERHTLAELQHTFDQLDGDPGEHCRLGYDRAEELVAYGWNHPFEADAGPRRVHVSGGVHPDHRGHGTGHVLLSWQLEAARTWYDRTRTPECGPLRVVAYVDAHRSDQRRLYEDLGLEPVRWFADMSRSLADALPAPEDPPGIRIVPFNRKRFEAVRAAHNEAFADQWGSRPIDREKWEKQLVGAESRLSWSWVALAAETSEVVGYATNAAHPDDWDDQGFSEGWTERLGVRPEWRHRGVARALLTASMKSFAEAGLDAAGLGVDTDDPVRAFALYEELGYRSTHTVVMYAITEDRVDQGAPTALERG